MIYTPKKYAGNLHLHLERMESGEILKGSVPVGVKKIDEMLIPIAPTDLGVVLANSGHGKCLGIGTKVIMYDGTAKKVEDIVVGDKLMGMDSTPRTVLSLARGREQMYWIRQNRAQDYRVNESHILSLKGSGTNKKNRGDVKNISVLDVINHQEKTFLSRWKGYKTGVEFQEKEIPLDAYFIGAWLGDGTCASPKICNMDEEILGYVESYSSKIGKRTHRYQKHNNSAIDISVSNYNGDKTDSVKQKLRDLNLLNNKHIPDVYKYNSSKVRLELLAGLIDTDGSLEYNGYRIVQKNHNLILDIKYVADSLGYRTTLRAKSVKIKDGDVRPYYELGIYGDIQRIPVKIKRKICKRKSQRVNTSITGIEIEKDIIDDYYGFTIDGDSLFLLEDFTVTHNSALMMHMTMNAARLHNADPKSYAPPIYITRETAIEELLLRMLANFAGINIKELKDNAPFLDWKTIHQQADEMMAEYPVVYIGHSIYTQDNRKMLDTEKAIECVKKVHDSYGAPSILVAVDYLQRFDWVGERDRRLSIARVVEEFKDLALTEKMPLMLGSQAKREVAERPYPVPMATDAMESANVEQTADWMISLMRPCKYWEVGSVIPKSKSNQIVTPDLFYLNVLKQRSGVTNEGTYASFDMRIFSLSSLDL